MVYSFDGFNYLIRLDKGERLSEALSEFVQKTNIEGGWVSGLGGVLEVELGFYNLESRQYQFQLFKGNHEMVGLQGNLAFNEQGKIMPHLHGVFANDQYQTIGGHVKDLVAAATVELFVHRSYKPIHRKTDQDVGLQTLNL